MIDETNKLIEYINKTELIKNIKNIKNTIINNDKSYNSILDFKKSKHNFQNNNIEKYKKSKLELLEDENVCKFINYQNEFNIISLYINNRILKIIKNVTK